MSIIDSKIYYWLSLGGMQPSTVNKILEMYTPLELWENYESIISSTELGNRSGFKALRQFRSEEYINDSLDKLRKRGIGVITRAVDKMPERLLQKEVSPPIVLYYKGDVSLLKTRCLAVVGSRSNSRYGEETAKKFVGGLVPHFTIVSGLAMGIDGIAQRAALDEGGKTIGVLGSGLACFSPICNEKLFEAVCESGLAVSEYPPDTAATKYSFPARNRLISGLSEGVLVVEANSESGALITADFANAQNREVYAVPGNLDREKAAGTNKLISKGEAKLVVDYRDILTDLKVDFKEDIEKKTLPLLDNFELKVYNLLKNGQLHSDELCLKLGIKVWELTPVLTLLEMKGIIKKTLASTYCTAQ